MTDPLAELSNRGVSDASWRELGDQLATALHRPPGAAGPKGERE